MYTYKPPNLIITFAVSDTHY